MTATEAWKDYQSSAPHNLRGKPHILYVESNGWGSRINPAGIEYFMYYGKDPDRRTHMRLCAIFRDHVNTYDLRGVQ